jgi:hypothetical protein
LDQVDHIIGFTIASGSISSQYGDGKKMERLLAKIDANLDANNKAMQERMEAKMK